ncbi:uncharacterized protein LAESUDRAFT_306849 [Laetiporus sulphureus 93-53]|uniref:Uncharacterized protein n=1 Tax=Laetiporus sulphureus 93-53 TaxID=1314785 RepID=A0A165D9D0_9APHY|nr:uncharacterized protein LAESUDRAFT_306849 [Laetiporus sulphureus 93-53]KZT04374.1 hypothetical protein LAESUDRAFT_306849 [Laetiporus sulphureus 93-53]
MLTRTGVYTSVAEVPLGAPVADWLRNSAESLLVLRLFFAQRGYKIKYDGFAGHRLITVYLIHRHVGLPKHIYTTNIPPTFTQSIRSTPSLPPWESATPHQRWSTLPSRCQRARRTRTGCSIRASSYTNRRGSVACLPPSSMLSRPSRFGASCHRRRRRCGARPYHRGLCPTRALKSSLLSLSLPCSHPQSSQGRRSVLRTTCNFSMHQL